MLLFIESMISRTAAIVIAAGGSAEWLFLVRAANVIGWLED